MLCKNIKVRLVIKFDTRVENRYNFVNNHLKVIKNLFNIWVRGISFSKMTGYKM